MTRRSNTRTALSRGSSCPQHAGALAAGCAARLSAEGTPAQSPGGGGRCPAARPLAAPLPAVGLRRPPVPPSASVCVWAGGPGSAVARGPQAWRDPAEAASAAASPAPAGDSSRSPPVTPGGSGRVGGWRCGPPGPAPRAAGRGCGRLRTASPAVPQCRALPLGPARGRWLPVAAAALAAEPARSRAGRRWGRAPASPAPAGSAGPARERAAAAAERGPGGSPSPCGPGSACCLPR